MKKRVSLRKKKHKNTMPTRSYSDKEIIDSFYKGIQEPLNWFYITSMPKFINHFKFEAATEAGKALENMRFRKDDSYIDDLFQDSIEKLLHKILDRKLFVEDDTVFVTRKNGSVEKLDSSLYSYLQGIGDLTLKTIIRISGSNISASWEDLLERVKSVGYEEGLDGEEAPTQPVVPPSSGDDADEEETEAGSSGLDIFSLIDDEDNDMDTDWNDLVRATKEIVANMKEPCKSIFRLTYYQENGKKMPDEKIAEEMGYSGSTVVKTTRNRCHNKFHKKLIEVFGEIKGYRRK